MFEENNIHAEKLLITLNVAKLLQQNMSFFHYICVFLLTAISVICAFFVTCSKYKLPFKVKLQFAILFLHYE